MSYCVSAQYYDKSIKPTNLEKIQNALNQELKANYLESDLDSWIVQSDASSRNKDAWYYYLVQTHNNIIVRNTITNILVSADNISINNTRFIQGLESKISTYSPTLSPFSAAQKALSYHGLSDNLESKILEFDKEKRIYTFKKTNDLQSDVKVYLVYEPTSNNEVVLTWNVNLDFRDGSHWWNTRINAKTGEFVNQNDWVVSCNFSNDKKHNHKFNEKKNKEVDFISSVFKSENTEIALASSYRVLPYYTESPNHGDFELIVNPDDATASPSGWHNDGTSYTTTRGNNVIARDDQNGNNGNGPLTNQSSAGLIFDYAYGGPSVAASSYIDSATTQLFYMTNIVHDIYYKYGFDEASGNFQETNFTGTGSAGDPVDADVQDGSGVNNANFGTPGDGGNPRMQMFLWDQGAFDPNAVPLLTINNTFLAGDYNALDNAFAPGNIPATGQTADLVLVIDNNTGGTASTDVNDGCGAIINAASLSGNVAVVRRGACNFTLKTTEAQSAGAIAILIVNNVAGEISMGGTDASISIPAYSINQADGNAIIAEMSNSTINATFNAPTPPPTFVNIDGDFDNGVVGHEIGHGINNRLVGGRFTTGCVSSANDESMGEGWADFIGKIIQLKNVDNGIQTNGVGTFVVGQATNGQGIRPAPYSGNIANNPMTYETLINDPTNATYTIPHGVGSVWAGILWDMTWDLIAVHGFTEDIYDANGTFGNTIALNIVVEGMKQAVCNPGFVEARNAILDADDVLYGNGVAGSRTGANRCIIYSAFARRGVGLSANQGTIGSTSDGAAAYDLPATCSPNFLIDNGDAGLNEICENTTSTVYDFVFYEQNAYDTDTSFVASGLPAGASVTFSPATMKDTGLFSMIVTGIPAGTTGTFPINITPGGDASKARSVSLVINPTNPDLTDGDTEFSIDSAAFATFSTGANIEFLPGSDIDLRLPASAFNGTLIWTGPDAATYTTNSLSFNAVADNDPAVEGAWTVQASFTNDCGSSFAPQAINFTINVNPSLSVEDNTFNDFKVFPNPTNGIVTISGLNNSNTLNIQLVDISGRVIYRKELKTINQNKTELDLSGLSTGTYFIQIETDLNKTVKKIIKR